MEKRRLKKSIQKKDRKNRKLGIIPEVLDYKMGVEKEMEERIENGFNNPQDFKNYSQAKYAVNAVKENLSKMNYYMEFFRNGEKHMESFYLFNEMNVVLQKKFGEMEKEISVTKEELVENKNKWRELYQEAKKYNNEYNMMLDKFTLLE